MSRQWTYGLFDCFGAGGKTCAAGFFCPCVLYGQVNYRLHHPADPKLEGYSLLNTPCALFLGSLWAFSVLIPCCCETVQRRHVIKKLDIKGGFIHNCLVAHCCTPCSLVQDDQEVRDWQMKVGAYALIEAQPGEQPPMAYAPPQA